MTRDELKAALRQVRAELHAQFEFPDDKLTHALRMQQADHVLLNAEATVDHLFDEEERERDLAQRVVAREKVHADHEVRPPIPGRDAKHYLAVAGRAGK